MIQQRMVAIINEYTQLKQFEDFELSLEAVNPPGAIKVVLKGGERAKGSVERVILPSESLDFITDTFYYPNTYSPRSKDIAPESVKRAYFDIYGDLTVEHEDSTEKFKVNPKNKEDVIKKLTKQLGAKFIKEIRVSDPTAPTMDNH